ncbi:bidirectional sugar transporter SWEET9 [Citrus clementina]|uniref:bidirectional sugar transporter SWEET9 n=1 Tax=Citrus clementina TaxID=85681 RepID=UPI000CECE83F|nr:bidirectional sugar transporter SWEET9 [Citrus x clementina]
MGILTPHQLAFIFGLLGNIVSFLVFLAPVPTFLIIYKKKSSEGYHSIPYVIALSSATLLLYYGLLKSNAVLIITINSIGCVIEVIYLMLYLIYAPQKQKSFTIKLILVFNVGAFALMMVIVNFFVKGPNRVTAVGCVCAVYNVAVFSAPLSIMVTINFFYGLFVKDMVIALPNVLGFLFGIAQMILYLVYKGKKGNESNQKQQECTEMKMNLTEDDKAYTKDNNQPTDLQTN